MRAMMLTSPGAGALEARARELPVALPGEVLVRVRTCGVCRTLAPRPTKPRSPAARSAYSLTAAAYCSRKRVRARERATAAATSTSISA